MTLIIQAVKSIEKWNALFLVAGTCIGGGMLALPVSAGVGGYIPSMLWLLVTWLMMTASSLLLMEASLWMKEGDHLITMSKKFLGPLGQAISWVLFLYISYASLVSYAAGGGDLITCSLSPQCFGRAETIVIVASFLTVCIGLGAKMIGRVNSILFFGMIGTYLLMIAAGSDKIQLPQLNKSSWLTSFFALPILLTSFSHQTMVPGLTTFLKRNSKALRFAIIGGTTIPFLVYAVWLTLILSIVPLEGEKGLIEAYLLGIPSTLFVNHHAQGSWIVPLMNFFTFFAIITSFLGIGMGLYDFLSDGLKIKEKGIGKLGLSLLILIPVAFFAVYYERAFLVAMETTGGIGDAIVTGIIPILIVYIGRYRKGFQSEWRVPGGKPILLLLAILFFTILLMELAMLSTNLVAETLKRSLT